MSTIRPLRRLGATLVIAGIAALGSVAVAPAASAASVEDGANYVIEGKGNGPDAFVVTATGRIPVFFCEDGKPGKEAKKAADEAEKSAKKAAEEADKAAKKAAEEAGEEAKAAYKAAKKAADEAEKAAKEFEKGLGNFMKQHNICEVVSPTGDRF